MRKALLLLALGAWLLARRRRAASSAVASSVTLGFADGSSVTLSPGTPGHERLAAAAGEAW